MSRNNNIEVNNNELAFTNLNKMLKLTAKITAMSEQITNPEISSMIVKTAKDICRNSINNHECFDEAYNTLKKVKNLAMMTLIVEMSDTDYSDYTDTEDD